MSAACGGSGQARLRSTGGRKVMSPCSSPVSMGAIRPVRQAGRTCYHAVLGVRSAHSRQIINSVCPYVCCIGADVRLPPFERGLFAERSTTPSVPPVLKSSAGSSWPETLGPQARKSVVTSPLRFSMRSRQVGAARPSFNHRGDNGHIPAIGGVEEISIRLAPRRCDEPCCATCGRRCQGTPSVSGCCSRNREALFFISPTSPAIRATRVRSVWRCPAARTSE